MEFSDVVGCIDSIRYINNFWMAIHLASKRGSTVFAPLVVGIIESLKI